MGKRVVVAVEMDTEFVRQMNLNVGLSGLREADRLTACQALSLAVLAEARGGRTEEVHALIPPEWRPHLRLVHEHREVTEDPPESEGESDHE